MQKSPNLTPKVSMNAEEYDVTSKNWRQLLCCYSRAGASSKDKRSLRVKVRRTAKVATMVSAFLL